MGGIESAFQFLGFKVDRIRFDTVRTLEALSWSGPATPNDVTLQLGIRSPARVPSERIYLGGMDAKVTVSAPSGEGREILASLELGVAGVFRTVQESLGEELEQNLVRLQIPAILLPYLRAAITSLLSSAGFPSILFPLVNVQELAKKADLTIRTLATTK